MADMHTRHVRTALLSVVAVACLLAAPLAAQESTTRGLVLGAHLGGASLTVENGDRANAGGGGLIVGYGVNRAITLFLQLDGANFDVNDDSDVDGTWGMGHADLGVRFNFANSLRSLVPYLQAAFSTRVVSVTDIAGTSSYAGEDVSFSGGALTLGGGLMVYLNESVALDLGLLFSGGEFKQVTVGNATFTGFDTDATTNRFNFGVVWWP